jgi:solute carrier family 25 protein 42
MLNLFRYSFFKINSLLFFLFYNLFVLSLVGQFATYPLDVMRRRMQVALAPNGGFVPNLRCLFILRFSISFLFLISLCFLFRSCIKTLYQQEGFRSFWKGFSINIIKGPIALSISLTVYDMLRGTIKDYSGSAG